jgi:hypothetical protein
MPVAHWDGMQAKSHIWMRAGPLQADKGPFLADAAHWRTALILVTGTFLLTLLIMQFGRAGTIKKGAKVALSHAWQLLHEAEKENRNVRPLPLSLAGVYFPRQLV